MVGKYFSINSSQHQGWKDSRNSSKKSNLAMVAQLVGINGHRLRVSGKHNARSFWEKGDLLLVDNFLVMHGRRPFVGPRKVLASLAS